MVFKTTNLYKSYEVIIKKQNYYVFEQKNKTKQNSYVVIWAGISISIAKLKTL